MIRSGTGRCGRVMESRKLQHTPRASQGQACFICFILVLTTLCNAEGSSVAYLKKMMLEKDDSMRTPVELLRLVDKPSLHISAAPKDVRVREGLPFSLRCEAQGIPAPVISWKFNGKTITQGEHEGERNFAELLMNIGKETVQSSNTAAQLQIPCATYKHAGYYECVAENGFTTVSATAKVGIGNAESLNQSSFLALPAIAQNGCSNTVLLEEGQRVPKIYMWTDFRFEVIGASVQLFCRASGYPEPIIKWYRRDGKEIVNVDGFNVLDNGDLLIRHGTWEDAGLYFCKASNDYGVSESQTFYYPTAVSKLVILLRLPNGHLVSFSRRKMK
ncbi:I-set domain containing protein [Trichuris trichiura]|uniref:I-set domain containing protein n=1 Tax=Trichuris trichiura TaxID=36087 RepID=A0A077Z175_TRITR|nr:I-set domain containing protein [Trichuris trichiura]